MAVHRLFEERELRAPAAPAGRVSTLSGRIVAEVREALFEKRLRPGDFLGTEKDIAARAGVSRIVARDALRTLEALGIVDIKVGAGGGARIAQGNPQLFAEALAVQLDLVGVGVREILDAQRAIECFAAELAAENATAADLERLDELLAYGDAAMRDGEAFTRACFAFHRGIAEASHNRVLVVQLVSLQHVSWPTRNPTLTPEVARHIQDVHRELQSLVRMRDGAASRRLMDDHIKMIRARRVAEHGQEADDNRICC